MQLRILLKRVIEDHGGFLTKPDVVDLAKLDRLRQVLIRCGGCRMVCAAQDVAHIMGLIESGDYVRDVSILAGDPAHGGDYSMRTFEGGVRPCSPSQAATLTPKVGNTPFPRNSATREQEYGGTFDGFNVTSDADPGL